MSYIVRDRSHPVGIDCTHFAQAKVINIIMLFLLFLFELEAHSVTEQDDVCTLKQNVLPITTNHSQLISYPL